MQDKNGVQQTFKNDYLVMCLQEMSEPKQFWAFGCIEFLNLSFAAFVFNL